MKITIDTKSKTAIVHGYASHCEIEDFLKAIFPLGWRSIQVEQTDEKLPENTVRDLTYKQ